MADCVPFHLWKVPDLRTYLHERGVVFRDHRKEDLIQLCNNASNLDIVTDPDGLKENTGEVIDKKLLTDDNQKLQHPDLLKGSCDLSCLPAISLFDVYNYLVSFDEFSHASLRDYHRLEGYGMFKDGYVRGLESVAYEGTDYVAIKAAVRPRTRDIDPITKKSTYSCWVILKHTADGCIHSSCCTCKGGLDGCCRHIVAALFEVIDYINDADKTSCTSQSCTWVRRTSQLESVGKPVPAADLDTSMLQDKSVFCPKRLYTPAKEHKKPDPEVFFEQLKSLCPSACMLRAKYVCSDQVNPVSPLTVLTPDEKLKNFITQHSCLVETCSCVNIFMYYHLCYPESDCETIEKSTCGQALNVNWHNMRKGLLTASHFHQICHSTNLSNTASVLLKGDRLNEACLPAAVLFGRKYESKARKMFIRGHRFRHRQCKINVPGLVMCTDVKSPYLARSPDGIVECRTCGRFLIEVKCLFKYKCFHPKNAIKMSNMCIENQNESLVLKDCHKYYAQIQGQMAITGVSKCVLVCYTHKGIATVDVDFDDDFWQASKLKMHQFYTDVYFPMRVQMISA